MSGVQFDWPVAPKTGRKPMSLALFESRFRKGEGCWEWTGARHEFGYGKVSLNDRTIGAHRLSYMVYVGPIPEGLFVLHTCDNPACVRPDHLFIGTAADNTADMLKKGRARTGERHRGARLTWKLVDRLRQLVGVEIGVLEAARLYNVSESTIRRVVNRQSWRGAGL